MVLWYLATIISLQKHLHKQPLKSSLAVYNIIFPRKWIISFNRRPFFWSWLRWTAFWNFHLCVLGVGFAGSAWECVGKEGDGYEVNRGFYVVKGLLREKPTCWCQSWFLVMIWDLWLKVPSRVIKKTPTKIRSVFVLSILAGLPKQIVDV